jgi:peptidoglycan-N-acetylglucosamine deacetylase
MKNKRIFWLIGIAFAIVAGWVFLWPFSKARTYQAFGEIISSVETKEKVVALTFDDGPTVNGTDKILEKLRNLDVRATFFLTGAELERYPAEGQKIAAAGHEIGNHSFSHERMVFVSPSYVKNEIETTDKLIRETGYQGEIHFRPPYGKKLFVLPYYLSKTNRKTIFWDIEPDSFPKVAESADNIARHVSENVKLGSIILLHVMYENRKTSFEAVEKIVNELRSQEYRFITVSELLALKNNQ